MKRERQRETEIVTAYMMRIAVNLYVFFVLQSQALQTQQAQFVNVLDLSKETDPGQVQGQPQIVTPVKVSEAGDNADEGIVLETPLIPGCDISPGEDGDKKSNRHGANDPSKLYDL